MYLVLDRDSILYRKGILKRVDSGSTIPEWHGGVVRLPHTMELVVAPIGVNWLIAGCLWAYWAVAMPRALVGATSRCLNWLAKVIPCRFVGGCVVRFDEAADWGENMFWQREPHRCVYRSPPKCVRCGRECVYTPILTFEYTATPPKPGAEGADYGNL